VTHTRPTGTGWVAGQQGEPVEILADPPGDGIGPDLTPPDNVPGLDPKELKRLQRDHERAVKDAGKATTLDEGEPELFETQHDEPTPSPFPKPPSEDPREQKAAAQDPREGSGKS
jgi:hypothetical protein